MNRLVLTVGDWSRDGHEKMDDFHIETPYTTHQIMNAYMNCVRVSGFDLDRHFEDYESGSNDVPEQYHELIKKAVDAYALETNTSWVWNLDHANFSNEACQPKTYLAIYLGMAKLSDPNFTFKVIQPSYNDRLNIGGYGCYY